MVWGWGFDDWNRILAAHVFATTRALNSRKFYQVLGLLMAYLSQDELLGIAATAALQVGYASFMSIQISDCFGAL